MITKPTLLILGAGASAPYGFPVARTLKTRICNELTTNDETWRDRIQRLKTTDIGEEGASSDYLSWERAEQLGSDLQRSPITSIDAFLENRREYRLVGKASIALALIPMEEKRRLFDDKDKWTRTSGIRGYSTEWQMG